MGDELTAIPIFYPQTLKVIACVITGYGISVYVGLVHIVVSRAYLCNPLGDLFHLALSQDSPPSTF